MDFIAILSLIGGIVTLPIESARTLEWIKGDSEVTNYFPPRTAIAPQAFQAPLSQQFPLVAQAEERLFAFNLTCPFVK